MLLVEDEFPLLHCALSNSFEFHFHCSQNVSTKLDVGDTTGYTRQEIEELVNRPFQMAIEVLEQLSKGLNYNKIAENLILSTGTVRKHIENIYKKLQVHNKLEAVQKAKKNNLI